MIHERKRSQYCHPAVQKVNTMSGFINSSLVVYRVILLFSSFSTEILRHLESLYFTEDRQSLQESRKDF